MTDKTGKVTRKSLIIHSGIKFVIALNGLIFGWWYALK